MPPPPRSVRVGCAGAVCAGQGQPGANLPDQRLYRELVHPAVERMTAGHGRHLSAPTTAAPKFVRFPDEEAQQ